MDGKWDLPQTRCAEVVNIWQEIRAIDLPPCVIEDRAVWTLTPEGNFHFIFAWDFARNKSLKPVFAVVRFEEKTAAIGDEKAQGPSILVKLTFS